MKRRDAILLKAFLYGVPLVIITAVFCYFYSLGTWGRGAGQLKLLNTLAGLILGLWMLLTICLCVRLLVSGSFRNKVLAKLTFIREGDEREVMLTGKATKATFLTSLAILIFLFCLSCFQVSIYQVPPERAVDGKTRMLSLGFGCHLLESSKPTPPHETLQKTDIFTYAGLPVSSTGVILLLIIWQIISYNYSMRRLIKNEQRIN
jgi:hypothetical protein